MSDSRLTLETAVTWLEEVLGQFPDPGIDLEQVEVVAAEDVPEAYGKLLVHTHHMTVTLEEKYRNPVTLEALKVRHEGDDYSRKLLLRSGDNGPIVLAGIMRFRLECVREAIRDSIIEGITPLGRILIENEVLRRIETVAFLRFPLGNSFGHLFGDDVEEEFTYGRIAIIYCDGEPAVELLELVQPGL